MGMKLAQPRGIADIGLASEHVLSVPRIDQNHIKPALLQDLVDRNPIDPRGFYRDTRYAARFEPVRQIMQVLRECAERAHRQVGASGVHRSHIPFWQMITKRREACSSRLARRIVTRRAEITTRAR